MRSREAQTLPVEQLAALQLARLQAQVSHLYEAVPFYRRRMDEAGAHPSQISTLADCPS